ncbi:transmembrane protein 101-like [Ruditapes philippinarum]|uniref:transmembrane protein 101-like n=1 Tax=Ruditapes philippinarum TaxID=129788 RepID=UPI00295AE3C9|nr:transmembrane protein 101-like [Ruditapes philippinarum]
MKKTGKKNQDAINGKDEKAGETVQKVPVNFGLQFSDLWENPELVLTNMATSISKAGRAIPEFLLAKFPYVQAISLIMLLAERALKMEKYPPMHPHLIYGIAVVCFITGCMMTAKIKLRFATLVYSSVLVYLTINAYTNRQFNYSRHVRNRIASRHAGCLGVYLIYSFIKSNRQSNLIHRIGELCISAYLLGSAYLINESYEDKRAVLENIPGGNYARYFLTIIFTCAGLCFISGYFLRDISMSMAFLIGAITILVDMKFSYWSYRGMAYWNQMRIVIDNLNLLTGFFVFMIHYENIARADAEAIQRAKEQEEQESDEEHDKQE